MRIRATPRNVAAILDAMMGYVTEIDLRTAYLHSAVKALANGQKLDTVAFEKKLAEFDTRIDKATAVVDATIKAVAV